jgi:hypothetical protein
MRLVRAAAFATVFLLTAGSALAQVQLPGSFVSPPCFLSVDMREGMSVNPDDEYSWFTLPCEVTAGYMVLLEHGNLLPGEQADPRNWSDVIAWTTGGPVAVGQLSNKIYFISDSEDPATGASLGITDADLAVAGLTVADIVNYPYKYFRLEGLITLPGQPDANVYEPDSPWGVAHYVFHSDPPEPVTPNLRDTWGKIKTLYR